MVNDIIRWAMKWRVPKIHYFMKKPHQVQTQTMHKLVTLARNTEWGKIHDYAGIKTYQQFQKNIPITAYEDFFPYIDRMMKGEQNILWHSPIHWFSKSSGTTNARSKFIPVSKEALKTCHFMGGRDVLSLYSYNNPKTKFFRGKGLSIGGTFQQNPENPKSYFGDISAVIVQNLPQWAQSLRTPPLEIAMMDKWEEKIERMAELAIKQNITSALGVPTWTIVLIQHILNITGKSNIREVWPNFEVFIHGAVAFTPYRKLFGDLVGNPKDFHFMETYNASEGFFGLQDDLSRDDMLLMLDYDVFYEFIPIHEIDSPNPSVYSLEEVELDKNYAIIISTNAGLWRYKIGDTVKFTSKYPYRIKITGRTKHFINAFGEEVVLENAETAISKACLQTEAIVNNFTAAPIYMGDKNKGGHEWLIEFDKTPNNMELFTQILDSTLKEVNSDYDAKRYKDMALQMPLVHSVPRGTFYNWLKNKGKLGGQNKVPRLSNSREYLDDILKLLNLQL